LNRIDRATADFERGAICCGCYAFDPRVFGKRVLTARGRLHVKERSNQVFSRVDQRLRACGR